MLVLRKMWHREDLFRRRLNFHWRYYNQSQQCVLHLPKATVYRFGESNKATPVFRDLDWKISEGESWAIVGGPGTEKRTLLETLLGHTRISPPPIRGLYPFLSNFNPPKDPLDCVALVSFAARRSAGSGEFYDYTARYGAVRDDDCITLRQSIFSDEVHGSTAQTEFDILTKRLDLTRLLDLPLVALSNGQTRRARIVKELLKKPEILLLDEPLTGLDIHFRPKLIRLLGEIHASKQPRIIMALRPQDPLPDWITHVATVNGSEVHTTPRSEAALHNHSRSQRTSEMSLKSEPNVSKGKPLVDAKNLNVRYQDRHVLKNIDWTIHEGDKWHLQGANGSGKTTLLAMITGDHPQSYIQPHLMLFGSHRRGQPTSSLQRMIGFTSPEVFNAFPRRLGPSALTVRDAIATGFESTFSYRPRCAEIDARIDEILRQLGPDQWGGDPTAFDQRPFALLSPGEQSMVLLLRALVGRHPLLILDEVFAGMDSRMIEVAKAYLRDGLDAKQAVIFVTHWLEEVPWDSHLTKFLRLDDGFATHLPPSSSQ
ncbi:P-loop containing nucleoside triphosphate hydrolase protein [Rickenella mellea]|uniref:P-loop containing nucleoside triphosphate hydrolase protein n=1 Tax=Rickenella mellea TaxID=50990 RepID=A0A4Y7Q7U6_9AGAM|nr:P-loop containing nucleoside triphosphate hydrolase protein [Rickenella mellea]